MGKRHVRVRQVYTAEFKLKVVQFSFTKNATVAAKLFHVNLSSVLRWRTQQKDLCLAVHNRKWRNGRGNILTETSDSIEQDLYKWVNDQMALYAAATSPSPDNIKQPNHTDIVSPVNHTEQNNDSNNTASKHEDDDLSEFHKNIRSLHSVYDYQLMDVGLVSETSVPFKKHNYTAYATLLLCALADGTKLKPLIIFKGQDLSPSIKIPPDVHICVAKKGFVEEPEILWWLKHVWKMSKHNSHRLLVSSISNTEGQESLRTLASKYCLTDVIQVPNPSKNSDFLSELFFKMCKQIILSRDILDVVNNTWKRLTERSIIDGFMDKDIVSVDDVYIKDDATDFLGFSQEDIDVAKETAQRVIQDVNGVINNLL